MSGQRDPAASPLCDQCGFPLLRKGRARMGHPRRWLCGRVKPRPPATPAKIAALGLSPLCRALPFFVIGGGQSGFIRRSSGEFGRGEEEWAVVTAHAPVAPDESEKEERARSIQPRHRLNPRTINFKIAAVRAALQPNSKHESITHYFSFASVSRRSELKKCAAS
jgi:hypothetical protein